MNFKVESLTGCALFECDHDKLSKNAFKPSKTNLLTMPKAIK